MIFTIGYIIGVAICIILGISILMTVVYGFMYDSDLLKISFILIAIFIFICFYTIICNKAIDMELLNDTQNTCEVIEE